MIVNCNSKIVKSTSSINIMNMSTFTTSFIVKHYIYISYIFKSFQKTVFTIKLCNRSIFCLKLEFFAYNFLKTKPALYNFLCTGFTFYFKGKFSDSQLKFLKQQFFFSLILDRKKNFFFKQNVKSEKKSIKSEFGLKKVKRKFKPKIEQSQGHTKR